MLAELGTGRRARLVYDWGLYAGALGDLALASRCYRIHGALVREEGGLEGLTTSLRALAYTERLVGSLTEALQLAETAAEVAIPRAVAGGRGAGAGAAGPRAARPRSRRRGRRVLRAGARAGRSTVRAALVLGRRTRARARSSNSGAGGGRGNLAGLHELGWAGHRAHAETILGQVALAGDEADPDRASLHLVHAREWTTATGEIEVVLRCHELEAQICLAERRFADAERAIRGGLTLAETCGFGLFAGVLRIWR